MLSKIFLGFLLIVTVGCSSVIPALKDTPLGSDGVLYFDTAGDWEYAIVKINGAERGWLHKSHSTIRLSPGDYSLTGFSRSSGYQGQYVSTLTMDIPFSIQSGKVTSLGTLAIFKNGSKNIVLPMNNENSALLFLSRFFPEISKELSKDDIQYADLIYPKSDQLDNIRQAFSLSHNFRLKSQGDYSFGELGVMASGKPGSRTFINTNTLQELKPAVQHPSIQDLYYFSKFYGDLYCYCDNEIEPLKALEGYISAEVAVAEGWMVAVNHWGAIKISTDDGSSWGAINVKLSNKYMNPLVKFHKDELFVGPITAGPNASKGKSKGVILNVNNTDVNVVGWSPHVTEKTQFYNVNGEYLFDPVNLGGRKAFLFRYDAEDQDWDEVRLPNRHCKVGSENGVIHLDCWKGNNFESRDAGRNWVEVNL